MLPQRPRFAGLVPLSCLLLLVPGAWAQKRSLTHRDYAGWRGIATQTLSRDGKILAYAVFPQEGDGELVIRDLAAGKERREPLGAQPPPPEPAADAPPTPEEMRARTLRMSISGDNRWLVSQFYPPKAESDQAKKDRKPAPRNGILIVDLSNPAAATRIPDVESFQLPEKSGEWLAYKKAAKTPPPSAPAKETAGGNNGDLTDQRRGGGGTADASGRRQFGTELILRHLPTGKERAFDDVAEYAISRDAKSLLYAVNSRKEETNGVFNAVPGTDAAPEPLLAGKGKYTRPVWDRENAKAALVARPEGSDFGVYVWNRSGAAQAIAATTTQDGCKVSDRASPSFSRDGARLIFPCAYGNPERVEAPPASPTAVSGNDDKVVADLWHWKDDFVQPMQKVRASQERNRSYRVVADLSARTFVQLTDPSMNQAYPSDDARFAVGADDRPYRAMIDYDAAYADLLLVDTASGARKRLFEKQRAGFGGFGAGPVTWSPNGQAFLVWRDKAWHSVGVPGGVVTNLTAGIQSVFYNEEDDHPEAPPAYGSAGWTKDGKWVLLYDRFDVWAVSPDGRQSRNLTGGAGRRDKIQFRVQRLDRADDAEEEERGIDPAKPLLLRAESEETRETGYFQLVNLQASSPQRLLWGPRSYRAVLKAKDSDVVLLTATTFREQPDLHVTDSQFRNPRKVTDVNPQQRQLLWGDGELIRYRNADGVALTGAVFKPENFDPKRKYPLLVYIYERLSQNVHQFVRPQPGTSINFSYYVSNGYVVLTPDIVYSVGSPGQSALKCVLPAIQALVDQGFINEKAIGIQGHSWGGYQIAYMITQTNRFRAAEAGAPVGNMTSAYNGIRWGSGMPRQFQYEKTQSRIGGSIWDRTLNFIENSPVFHADRVNTPLLMLHDDQDDAVPWYQGIEMYLSLRRLNKEVYLWNYNGEFHGLRRRPDQKDFTVRMQEYFDYFLKDQQKPAWMEKGIPFTEREKEKERIDALYGQPQQ